MANQRYFGNWEIEEEIGSGAFGTVYKISKEEFGCKYYSAMKVIRVPQDKNEKHRLMSEGMDEDSISTYYYQCVQDFIKEIELMSSLQGNTNIVDYNDHLVQENEDGIGYTIYIRMEYLTPLDKYLVDDDNRFRALSSHEIIKLGIDICNALEVCNKNHIIHRDIKPDNIFVSKNGDYKLGDFGISRQLEHTQSNLSKKGTYTYMAPEVYNGQPYNSTVDIYSLGIVLYRLFNHNRTPFLPAFPNPIKYSDKEKALISRMQGNAIPEIPNVPKEINSVILKCCAFNAKERYQSPSELKADLLAVSDSTIMFDQYDDYDDLKDEYTKGPISDNLISNIQKKNDNRSLIICLAVLILLVIIVVPAVFFGISRLSEDQPTSKSAVIDTPATTAATLAASVGIPGTKEEIVAKYNEVINAAKKEQNVTIHKTGSTSFNITDCSTASFTNTINALFSTLAKSSDHTYTVVGGSAKNENGEAVKLNDVIAPSGRDCTLSASDVAFAYTTARAAGGGYTIIIRLNEEKASFDGTKTVDSPGHESCVDVLDFAAVELPPSLQLDEASMIYPGTDLTADVNDNGQLEKLAVDLAPEGSGIVKIIGMSSTFCFESTMTEKYEFIY